MMAEDMSTGTVARDLTTDYRDAISHLAAGVVIVTTTVDGEPWGMTVSACCSIAADPPTVLVSLTGTASAVTAIRESGVFGVSVLGTSAVEVARFSAKPGQPKFIGRFCPQDTHESDAAEVRAAKRIVPAIAGSLAHLDCKLETELVVHDHIIFIGRVIAVEGAIGGVRSWEGPLVYYRRNYYSLTNISSET
jgi:flavin reductase (DIM6/NTAB) family NADH-FMN oxidoreductase RutF